MGNSVSNNRKGGDRHRWTQMLLSPDVHKRLKQIALDRDVTLKDLLEDIVKIFVNKESSHGRRRSSSQEEQEAE